MPGPRLSRKNDALKVSVGNPGVMRQRTMSETSERIFLCTTEQLPQPGRGRAFAVDMAPPADAGPLFTKTLKDGRNRVAIFNGEAGFYACDDRCPHLEAPLADGKLHRNTVTCNWHHWVFDLNDGRLLMNQKCVLRVYAVEIDGDSVYLRLQQTESGEVSQKGSNPASPA